MLATMHLELVLFVFGIIFISELPDKSLFASLIMSTRYPSWYVWIGAASAFLVHVVIAVSLGKFLTLLPHSVLELVIGILFLIGGLIVFFGKHGLEENHQSKKLATNEAHDPRKIIATAFTVIFIGEWGDITQIMTANYAAHYHDPLSVAIGAVLGLWCVTALAIIVGKRALTIIPPRVLQLVTALALLSFAVSSFTKI